METLQFKQETEDGFIEYIVTPSYDEEQLALTNKEKLDMTDSQIDLLLDQNKEKVDAVNEKIDIFTPKTDKLDMAVSVGSGIIAGLLDLILVRESKLKVPEGMDAVKWAQSQSESSIVNMAKFLGYKNGDLSGAMKFLTEGANAQGGLDISGIVNTLGGAVMPAVSSTYDKNTVLSSLITSLLTQFTGFAYDKNTDGAFTASELLDKSFLGQDIEHKIFNGVAAWALALIKNAAAKKDIGNAMGIPAPLMDVVKQMAELPAFKNMNLSDSEIMQFVNEMSKNMSKGENLGEAKEIVSVNSAVNPSFDTMPVIANECVVRAFYFITRLGRKIREENIQSFAELKNINLRDVLPFNNATIVKMMTVSLGAMEAIDIAGAAVNGAASALKAGISTAAVSSAGGPVGTVGGGMSAAAVAFWKTFVLNVNFAGVGRMAISCVSSANIGAQRDELLTERIELLNDRLRLTNSKVLVSEADMWIAAEEAGKAIDEAYSQMGKTSEKFREMVESVRADLENVGIYVPEIEKKNPGLTEKMRDYLKWGI